MCASIREVVVLPFVPVMLATGILVGEPGGNSISITLPATSRGSPSDGATCIRKPGAALTSTIAPPISLYDSVISAVRKSTPPTSRPTAWIALTAISRLSGCTTSVRSMAVPPVDRFAVLRRSKLSPFGNTVFSSKPAASSSSFACRSSSSRVNTFSWPIPRRGSSLVSSISSAIVLLPSPVTWPGTRLATATNSLFTTSIRWS